MARNRTSIVDFFHLELPFVTEFRRLLQKLQDTSPGSEMKTLLFTSAMLAEGKSTVCAFLALTAAKHKGMKTLLLDCDLRRSAIHRFFDMDRVPGLSDILSGRLGAEDCVRKTAIETLDVITAGGESAHPAEVLDCEAVGRLVDEMKFYYDLILVDTAPVLPVSDPMLLAPIMDGVILVVKAGATQREVVKRAVEIIDSSRHRILGVVLNNMNNCLPYYYGHGYYRYSYGRRSPERQGSSQRDSRHNKRRKRSAGERDQATDGIIRPP